MEVPIKALAHITTPFPNSAGCDSLMTLNLTINQATSSTQSITACDSFFWNGSTYKSSGTYYDTIPNAAGCDSLMTLNLTINNVSDLTTTISGNTITANNINATYQWLDCNSNFSIFSGETGQSFTPTNNGNYAVELTENGCVDTSVCVAFTKVGVLENSFGNNIQVFPNPTNGTFSIDLGNVLENTQVSITDISGRLIYTKNISQSKVIDLSIEEPAGIYIISIQSDNKIAIIRLIKE
jgi:hypothetical protein